MSSEPPPARKRPRYQKVRDLGSNAQGTRQSSLGKDNRTGEPVVLKQFLFAKVGADWVGFEAYKPELTALFHLQHPQIPRHLNFLPLPEGFCAVREYKQARPLAECGDLELAQIQQIGISLLEVLVYLQSQEPPIVHRNIKPENLLVDDDWCVSLTDFSFPFISKRGTVKQAIAGSTGFMPREQARDRDLTLASDLYAVGATLTCLLTGKNSTDIAQLVGADGRLNVAGSVPKETSMALVQWLETCLEPYANNRHTDAATALATLRELELTAHLKQRSTRIYSNSSPMTTAKFSPQPSTSATQCQTPDCKEAGKWLNLNRVQNRENPPLGSNFRPPSSATTKSPARSPSIPASSSPRLATSASWSFRETIANRQSCNCGW